MLKAVKCNTCKKRHFNGYQCDKCKVYFGTVLTRWWKFCPKCGTKLCGKHKV